MADRIKLYPKTTRMGKEKAQLTEKLDGSNLGFFKLNNELYVAQRNWIFTLEEALQSDKLYKGLLGFINENIDNLNKIVEGAIIFGEWIGMGRINYKNTLSSRYLLFAKARIIKNDEGQFSTFNYRYNVEELKYAFDNQEIPSDFGVVPVIEMSDEYSLYDLDNLYSNYIVQVGRDVEGFVLTKNNIPQKYVRHKNGKLINHFESK